MVMEDVRLRRLNSLAASDATTELLKCCGSRGWARRLSAERPFENLDELIDSSDRVWWSLEPGDWLEAFRSHPKIGEKKAASEVAVEAQKWSEDEQSGVRNSVQETTKALAELNGEYEEKFGYIFIVCASGKSSEEMLDILRERLGNGPEKELQIAAAEQAKITRLRLAKLLAAAR
jgi:OHCU decarboxylase